MYYHMQKLRGLEVAAMYQQGNEEQQQGVSPHWKTYFTVDDIAKTTEQANESGATVMLTPSRYSMRATRPYRKTPRARFLPCHRAKTTSASG